MGIQIYYTTDPTDLVSFFKENLPHIVHCLLKAIGIILLRIVAVTTKNGFSKDYQIRSLIYYKVFFFYSFLYYDFYLKFFLQIEKFKYFFYTLYTI